MYTSKQLCTSEGTAQTVGEILYEQNSLVNMIYHKDPKLLDNSTFSLSHVTMEKDDNNTVICTGTLKNLVNSRYAKRYGMSKNVFYTDRILYSVQKTVDGEAIVEVDIDNVGEIYYPVMNYSKYKEKEADAKKARAEAEKRQKAHEANIKQAELADTKRVENEKSLEPLMGMYLVCNSNGSVQSTDMTLADMLEGYKHFGLILENQATFGTRVSLRLKNPYNDEKAVYDLETRDYTLVIKSMRHPDGNELYQQQACDFTKKLYADYKLG